MNKIFSALRRYLAGLSHQAPSDPLATMTGRELADLPAYHPQPESRLHRRFIDGAS